MTISRSKRTANARRGSTRNSLALLPACVCILAVGCGGESDGVRRYTVSGEITHKGQPLPVGFIRFAPDTSKGNKGPGGGAPIKEGRFETPRDKGIVGGSYVISITGADGVPTTQDGETLKEGKLLFSLHQTEFDFPKEDTEWSYEVPSK